MSKSSCTPGYKSVIIKISKRINLCSKCQIAKILTNAEPGKEWHRRRPMQRPQRRSQSLLSLRFEDLEFFIRNWFVLWPNEGTFTHCYHLAVKSWSRNSLPAQIGKLGVEIGYILLTFGVPFHDEVNIYLGAGWYIEYLHDVSILWHCFPANDVFAWKEITENLSKPNCDDLKVNHKRCQFDLQ